MFLRKLTFLLSKLIIKPIIGNILGRFSAISFFFFICYKSKKHKQNEILTNHELIHFYQQVEMLFIFQWLFYGYYYLKFKNKGYSNDEAYMNIPFEKEAYDNQDNLEYLNTRKTFNWINYI